MMNNTTFQDIKADHQNYVLTSWAKQKSIQAKVIAKAEGVFFWDENDNRYFDMSSQLVYANVGTNTHNY